MGLGRAALAQLDLGHRRSQPRGRRVHAADHVALRGERQERLRGRERAPGGPRVPRFFLRGERLEGHGERLADNARIGVRARGLREHRGRRLRHPELAERHGERQRDERHARVQPIALRREPERRRGEEILILAEILVLARGLAARQWLELVEEVDAVSRARVLSLGLERGGEVPALRHEQLVGLHPVERRDRARGVAVAQVERHGDERARFERAPGLGRLFARGRVPRLAEDVA